MYPDGRREAGWDDGECQLCGQLMFAVDANEASCPECCFNYCLTCGFVFTKEDGEPAPSPIGSCLCGRNDPSAGPGPMAPEGRARLRDLLRYALMGPEDLCSVPIDADLELPQRRSN